MNKLFEFILKGLRYGYQKISGVPKYTLDPVCSLEEGGEYIYQIISKGEPCMLARYGMTEMSCLTNYFSITKNEKDVLKYIQGKAEGWWWNPNMINQMERWSGFFPSTEDNLARFCQLMISDSYDVDAIAVWDGIRKGIKDMKGYLPEDIQLFPIFSYDSFLLKNPWTRVLKNKKVLVVHPFAELIESQYAKRELLFENPDVLPPFELILIKAVQSLGGVSNGFSDWFEALEWMKSKMDKLEYDIALIGCGAYGFPLAAHAKRTGHQALHIGGSLQLLFGIKGSRWEDPNHAVRAGLSVDAYTKLFANPEWVRPSEYRTREAENVENACYW